MYLSAYSILVSDCAATADSLSALDAGIDDAVTAALDLAGDISVGLPMLPHAYGQPPRAPPVSDRPALFILALLPAAPALAMMAHTAPALITALGRRRSMLGSGVPGGAADEAATAAAAASSAAAAAATGGALLPSHDANGQLHVLRFSPSPMQVCVHCVCALRVCMCVCVCV